MSSVDKTRVEAGSPDVTPNKPGIRVIIDRDRSYTVTDTRGMSPEAAKELRASLMDKLAVLNGIFMSRGLRFEMPDDTVSIETLEVAIQKISKEVLEKKQEPIKELMVYLDNFCTGVALTQEPGELSKCLRQLQTVLSSINVNEQDNKKLYGELADVLKAFIQ